MSQYPAGGAGVSEYTPGPWEIEGLTIYKLEHGG